MSAHRQLWASLHATGKCDDCDDERTLRDQEHADEQRDEPADDGRSE